jgi:hypothetical protein
MKECRSLHIAAVTCRHQARALEKDARADPYCEMVRGKQHQVV